MLGAQELPCVGQLAFCSLIIFLCSYILLTYNFTNVFQRDAIEYGQPDTDMELLKEALALQEGRLSQSDGDSNSNPVAGSSNPPGPVNYISFLTSEGLFPPTCTTTSGTTLLLSSPGKDKSRLTVCIWYIGKFEVSKEYM